MGKEEPIVKFVKIIITAIIAFSVFAVGAELFQLHLQAFSSSYFFMEIEDDDRDLVCSIVTCAAEKYGEHVFAVERQDIDAFHTEIRIYADENMKNILYSEQDISEGEARSFFSGTTEIRVLPFEEKVDNAYVTRYYFTGSKDTVSSIRQNINSQIAGSYIHKESMDISEKLIYGIWMVCLGLVLMLTWIDIQFSKKADFLKISMGCSVSRMICEKIILDLVVDAAIFGAAYIFLRDAIFVAYKQRFICSILLVFFVLNSLLYMSLFKSDYKEIIYGANINAKLLANTYLLQTLVLILIVVSLSSALTEISENEDALEPYHIIEQLDGYNTLAFMPADLRLEEEDTERLKSKIFLEAYLQNKILLSTSSAAIEDDPIIVMNETALGKVVTEPEVFQTESEDNFIVYIPEERYSEMDRDDIEFAAETTASGLFGLEDYSFDTKTYSSTDVVYFDLREVSELPYGADLISDPVIVYCNLSAAQISDLIESGVNLDIGDRWANILFGLEDVSFFSEDVVSQIESVSWNSVVDQCSQYKNSMLRTLALNLIISAFMLVLSVLLISVTVKMEYLIHSRELAVKKILGYSMAQRNRAVLVIHIFAIMIAFVTGVILSKMYGVFSVWMLCMASLFVLFVDILLMLRNMAVAERRNTAHILKGDCL